jgi:hypothetical protein
MAPRPSLLFLLAAGATAVVPRCTLGPGANGPSVSCIAYGTLHMGRDVGTPEGVLALLNAALANGITTLDTSDVYSQMPELLGRALALQPGLRESFEIIAKTDIIPALGGVFGFDSGSAYDGSCAHLNSSVERYLAALNSSYVDVLMFHHEDYLLDIDAFASCAAALRAAGSVRHFGASNFGRDMFAAVNKKVPLVANELEVSVLAPTPIYDGTAAFHYGLGATILAWGPVGGDAWGYANRLFSVGSLDSSQHNQRLRSALATVATQLGTTQDVVCVAWLLRHPSKIVPIIGTMNATRIAAQAGAVEVAAAMTSQQWYHLADAAGVKIW